jgi:hypothetical protein
MSWKAEVIADGSGNWAGNAVRFATKEEAIPYAIDLRFRWTAVRDFRVVECDDPVNYRWVNGRGLEAVDEGASQ